MTDKMFENRLYCVGDHLPTHPPNLHTFVGSKAFLEHQSCADAGATYAKLLLFTEQVVRVSHCARSFLNLKILLSGNYDLDSTNEEIIAQRSLSHLPQMVQPHSSTEI